MKVRCIDNTDYAGEELSWLKLGEIYEVIEECCYSYNFIDENGKSCWCGKARFEKVED